MRDRANLREEILDAARALFVKEGYDHVSIRQIADKIEYSPGTIYLHFKDKADIFVTICNETFGKLHVRLSAIAADTCPPIEKLERAGRAYIHFALENPSHYTMVFMAKATQEIPASEGPSEAGRLCFEDLCQIVQQCIQDSLLRSNDYMEVSQTVWAAVHGVASLLITVCGFPFIEQNRLIDAVLRMTLDGVRKPLIV